MATLYRHPQSGIYYINWFEGKQQFRRSLRTRSQSKAESYLHAKELELRGHDAVVPTLAAVSSAPILKDYAVGEYLPWFESNFPTSYRRVESLFRNSLLPAFGSLHLNQVDNYAVDQWKVRRLRENSQRVKKGRNGEPDRVTKVKAETVNKELRQLKACLAQAVEWKKITEHPCESAQQLRNLDSKPPRYYTEAELKKLYLASGDRRWWWQFAVNTGLRVAELARVKRDDIRQRKLYVESKPDARTKSGKWREIPISPGAAKALEHLPKEGKLIHDMHLNSLGREFRKDAKRAGIGGSIHVLRHTFCSHLALRAKPAKLIQTLAGHASIQTTEKYMHLHPDHMKGALAGFSL